MARQARQKSESGVYHVMLRGINKQQIFFDEQDYKKFISVLIACKKIDSFQLYAYCLMPNHIHLLIKETSTPISTVMKRIGCKYVYWYNAKYARVGHLFQDRFRSEPIDTDEYLLCALRYIHYNPIEAGFAKKCVDYAYSSYQWYFEDGILIDKDFIFNMMSVSQFQKFHREPNNVKLAEPMQIRAPITDENAQQILGRILSENGVSDYSELNQSNQKKCVLELKANACSVRQIVRLTGAKKSAVEKI